MIRRHRNTIVLVLVIIAIIFAGGCYLYLRPDLQEMFASGDVKTGNPVGAGKIFQSFFGTEETEKTVTQEPIEYNHIIEDIPEDQIYTFLQGPKAWEEQVPWSGQWCEIDVDGNTFGGFGCGFCCMANIYSTLSPYVCSPVDIYEFTDEHTDYTPTGSVGAVDWVDMYQALGMVGMKGALCTKPQDYALFQEQVICSYTSIVLVCSTDDDTFWCDTPGHYVNIWDYNIDDDTVMIAEPGSPTNNRTRIPLHYVYDAMKMSSQYQYLRVDKYEEDSNVWKGDGIDDNWVSPIE